MNFLFLPQKAPLQHYFLDFSVSQSRSICGRRKNLYLAELIWGFKAFFAQQSGRWIAVCPLMSRVFWLNLYRNRSQCVSSKTLLFGLIRIFYCYAILLSVQVFSAAISNEVYVQLMRWIHLAWRYYEWPIDPETAGKIGLVLSLSKRTGDSA